LTADPSGPAVDTHWSASTKGWTRRFRRGAPQARAPRLFSFLGLLQTRQHPQRVL